MSAALSVEIPAGVDTHEVKCGNKKLTLTNLQKIFWPELGKTKRELLLYYAAVADAIIPHLANRALIMGRYPKGIGGEFSYIKRAPEYRPPWLATCPIQDRSGKTIEFPMVQDLASLLWLVNLGCIDIKPWYGKCNDTERPDFLHFDLDPVAPAGFREVRFAALLVKSFLDKLRITSYPKTSGLRGIHVYVPIYRKHLQKEVWKTARRVAVQLGRQHPQELTAEHRISRRLPGRVLVDYNQNASGRTLVCAYSLRANRLATVSTPVSWDEVEAGLSVPDFTITTVPERLARTGDLFKPLIQERRRCTLEAFG